MNLLDILLIIFGIFSFISGYIKGFIYQIIKLFFLIVSYLVSKILSPILFPFLFSNIEPVFWSKVITFGLIFLLTYFFLNLILYIFGRTKKDSKSLLKILDRLVGGTLSVLKFYVIIYLIFCITYPFENFINSDYIRESKFYNFSKSYNILKLDKFLYLKSYENLILIFTKNDLKFTFLNNKEFEKYFENTKGSKLFDPAVKERILKQSWFSIFREDFFQSLLNDEEFLKRMEKIDISKLLSQKLN